MTLVFFYFIGYLQHILHITSESQPEGATYHDDDAEASNTEKVQRQRPFTTHLTWMT